MFAAGTPKGYLRYVRALNTVIVGSGLGSFNTEANKDLTHLVEALLGFSDDVEETAEARCLAQTASPVTDDYKIPAGAARIVVTYTYGE